MRLISFATRYLVDTPQSLADAGQRLGGLQFSILSLSLSMWFMMSVAFRGSGAE